MYQGCTVTKTSHLPIRYFLALLWAHPILHISTIRVNFSNIWHNCGTVCIFVFNFFRFSLYFVDQPNERFIGRTAEYVCEIIFYIIIFRNILKICKFVMTNFDILLIVHLNIFILTLWRRNYFFNFSTPCIWNVNNTGTKRVSIMKQTAFWREKDGEYRACLKYSVPIFVE